MKNLKTKEQVILEQLNSIYESVHKMGDEYRISGIVIPKNIVNQFISKAKKDYNVDAKENFSEIDLAQMLVDFVIKNYLNVDSLPVKTILGIEGGDNGEIKDEIIDTDTTDEFTDATEQDTEDFGPENIEGEFDGDEITAEFNEKKNESNEEHNNTEVDPEYNKNHDSYESVVAEIKRYMNMLETDYNFDNYDELISKAFDNDKIDVGDQKVEIFQPFVKGKYIFTTVRFFIYRNSVDNYELTVEIG